jgi:hypothetical protein
LNILCNFKVKYCISLFVTSRGSPPIVLVYMDYYDGSMTHATYFWVLMNTNMGSFLECGYGSNVGMGGSTLTPKIPQNPKWVAGT